MTHGDNKPPYVLLELNKEEAEFIYKQLQLQAISTQADFETVAAMSSADPRAQLRASASMRLACDLESHDAIADRFKTQQPELQAIDHMLKRIVDNLQDD